MTRDHQPGRYPISLDPVVVYMMTRTIMVMVMVMATYQYPVYQYSWSRYQG